jgi:glutamate synthase (ferredoxin)
MADPPPCHGPRSLLLPGAEHDACGVGFVASLTGPSHTILQAALAALGRLAHRGAAAADDATGDGAGILTQVPERLLRADIARLGRRPPEPGALAVGVLFLPPDPQGRDRARAQAEEALRAEGVALLGWRPVPVRPEALGPAARAGCPAIEHLLATRPTTDAPDAFEQRLYRARRRMERAFAPDRRPDGLPYVASLSARTIVYKGLMLAPQLAAFYPDLERPEFEAAAVIFHQRYSTNTASIWPRAQPFRRLGHNGEINTLQGNVNWMLARAGDLATGPWASLGDALHPVVDPETSDSGMLDNVVELLQLSGRDLRQVMMMLIPEAWEGAPDVPPDRRAFYRYHACLTEPWDGPAAVVFGDGRLFGAILDRNGLRPMRYTITDDGLVLAASEAGVLDVDPARVHKYGKLGPGDILCVDVAAGTVMESPAVKAEVCARRPYAAWVREGLVELPAPAAEDAAAPVPEAALRPLMRAFAYTHEEMVTVLRPMVEHGKEAVGSMGDDTPHAVLSAKERPLFHYFKQRFAQVTNPPIDHLREEAVFSLRTRLGPRRSLLEETPAHARLVELPSPVLLEPDMAALRALASRDPSFRAEALSTLFAAAGGPDALLPAVEGLCARAAAAVDRGAGLLILSDRGVDADHAAIPALMALGAVHHHLLRTGRRLRADLIVESAEPREVHHVAALLGYGANAVHPYLALAVIARMVQERRTKHAGSAADAASRYRTALEDGLKKVMAKMGISTLDAYTGAQTFEAVGIDADVIARCFPGTASAVGGNGFREFGELVLGWHAAAFPEPAGPPALAGYFRFREGGEHHAFSPAVVAALQAAARAEGEPSRAYAAFRDAVARRPPTQLRHLLELAPDRDPVPLCEVEPVESILRRFSAGSMSLGSLSPEAHETLAVAMNRLGARSGSGEGGEDAARFADERNSAIKQVASGRFGVTPAYLASAQELQIKMAQGSKPGEGGQIPGSKVTGHIARLRHTTPGVALISPPPHHDIYSIEDLAQLIYDLRQANPAAEISVKLVAERGVGIVAAGVAKGRADIILISGHAGGTGSSPLSSIKHAGLPWEIGLAEAQQTLLANGLRQQVALRVDGGLQTGRDVVLAALLGADEFSFGTSALVAGGCTMMRICHTDNCPVGVATQKEELRRRFAGRPEHVMQYFRLVAAEVREILAGLGYRRLDEVIGRTDLLRQVPTGWPAADRLDLSPLLAVPEGASAGPRHRTRSGGRPPASTDLQRRLLELAEPAIRGAGRVVADLDIANTDRSIGAGLAVAIARCHGDGGLPAGTIHFRFTGVAGQSFGAFLSRGVTFHLQGLANDYVGKGLAGGEIVLVPDGRLRGPSGGHVLLGNTVLYGATAGALFARGRAGERFAVRNSGAVAVVEGVGDHGCEYMTGGTVVVLGPTGANFAAGMTGGEAFVLDGDGRFAARLNPQVAHITPMQAPDERRLHALVQAFAQRTGSERALAMLADWQAWRTRFVRVAPREEVREISAEEEGAAASA